MFIYRNIWIIEICIDGVIAHTKYERGEQSLGMVEFLEVGKVLGVTPCELLGKL